MAECLAQGHGELAGLVARAHELAALGKVVRGLLGSPLDRHVQVANFDHGRLVLLADSSAWAARARFVAANLSQRLAAQRARVSEVKIITRPPQPEPVSVPRPRGRISAATARLLMEVAVGLEPGGLRERMMRLAERGPVDP